jgi:hypothetical protein
LARGFRWHSRAFNDAADLGLEAHVEHAIGFIQDEEARGTKRDKASVDEILQAAGGGDQQCDAAGKLRQLRVGFGTAIDAS